MAVRWSRGQRTRVEIVLEHHPPSSARCAEAAVEILPVALERDRRARCRKLRAVDEDAPFVLPKVPVGGRWYHHVAVEVEDHYVDALTGADGTARDHYLHEHWRYPDGYVWQDWVGESS